MNFKLEQKVLTSTYPEGIPVVLARNRASKFHLVLYSGNRLQRAFVLLGTSHISAANELINKLKKVESEFRKRDKTPEEVLRGRTAQAWFKLRGDVVQVNWHAPERESSPNKFLVLAKRAINSLVIA